MALDQAKGVLLGLACGDGLGRPVEFKSQDQIRSAHGTLTEMIGNGTWSQPAGTVTDDTDQALCIAHSLVDLSEFNPDDIADRFVDWYDSGPFDIGNMTRRSLRQLKRGRAWNEAGQRVWEDSSEGSDAGNGSVMRCPPLAVAYPDDVEALIKVSRQSSQITHADSRCTDGCAILNLTIAALLRKESDPLSTALTQVQPGAPDELVTALEPIAHGTEPDTLSTSGYVVHSLQTALFDGLTADSAEDAIVTTVNRGGDADTIGAIAGAVAGARFGASDLPDRWLSSIEKRDELATVATQLMELQET
jgi:ADP-ribosyl-[dinitrogen reductase] hydrolase